MLLKKLALCAIIGVAVTSCNADADKTDDNAMDSTANNNATADSTDGWISLFDGKTTAGWHGYLTDTVGSAWKVINGELHLDTTNKVNGKVVGGGNILTDESFENFHLQVEWNISKNGNSGIMFLTQEDKKYEHPYWTAPEMQVLDNNGHPDAKIPKHRAGDLYDLISCSTEVAKGPGEWNLAEIIVNKGELTFKLNGTEVVKTMMWTPEWNTMIAKSKFKEWPDFAKAKSGKICLQDHDNQVAFRNIRIRKL